MKCSFLDLATSSASEDWYFVDLVLCWIMLDPLGKRQDPTRKNRQKWNLMDVPRISAVCLKVFKWRMMYHENRTTWSLKFHTCPDIWFIDLGSGWCQNMSKLYPLETSKPQVFVNDSATVPFFCIKVQTHEAVDSIESCRLPFCQDHMGPLHAAELESSSRAGPYAHGLSGRGSRKKRTWMEGKPRAGLSVSLCPSLQSGACTWGPAVPTTMWHLLWRSGSAHCDLELAVEERMRMRRMRRQRMSRDPLLKSDNPWQVGEKDKHPSSWNSRTLTHSHSFESRKEGSHSTPKSSCICLAMW